MKYIIDIHESDDPNTVRYWATVESLDGCNIAEETIGELIANAPGIIKDFIEVSNEDGANLPMPSHFEFRHLVHA